MKKDLILIRPILTEKFLRLQETENKYAFQVNPDANKIEIRNAVENKFDVKVNKVAVMNVNGKEKEMTIRSGGQVIRTRGKRSDWKKAIVSLVEGDNIDYYQGETAV
ncbi:MAG: 50S ribosomal protein L23 [Candidatus Marinimicrobia bacterium]|nr:50S ribosomal protein L23 [Candidatus Neomarinimicrobiota bacterium]